MPLVEALTGVQINTPTHKWMVGLRINQRVSGLSPPEAILEALSLIHENVQLATVVTHPTARVLLR